MVTSMVGLSVTGHCSLVAQDTVLLLQVSDRACTNALCMHPLPLVTFQWHAHHRYKFAASCIHISLVLLWCKLLLPLFQLQLI